MGSYEQYLRILKKISENKITCKRTKDVCAIVSIMA